MAPSGIARAGWAALKACFAPAKQQACAEEDDDDVSPLAFPPVVLSAKAKAMLAEGRAMQKDRDAPRERVLRGSLQERMGRGGR